MWGNVGKSEVLDASCCTIHGDPAMEVVGDDDWLSKTFVKVPCPLNCSFSPMVECGGQLR